MTWAQAEAWRMLRSGELDRPDVGQLPTGPERERAELEIRLRRAERRRKEGWDVRIISKKEAAEVLKHAV